MAAAPAPSDDPLALARARRANAAACAQRMNRVLDHNDAHLDGELDLAPLADVAHCSPFHFHRLCLAVRAA